MATDNLTDDQRELLQRWFDGELDAAQARRAEQLVESSDRARAYVDSLEDVRAATRAAFESATAPDAGQMDTDAIVEAAVEAPPAASVPLPELAPLLERYYDGEVTAAERRTVDDLVDERDDVRDYLDHLEFLSDAVRGAQRVAVEGVDIDAIWEGVDRDVAFERHPDDPPAFDPERDQQLLHRYVDGELPETQRKLVEAWLEDDDGEAAATVAALEELQTATQTAYEEAGTDVDVDGIWEGVEARLDEDNGGEDDDGGDADVVDWSDVADSQSDGGRVDTDGPADSVADETGGTVERLADYRQVVVGAAAALALVAVGAFVGPKLFDQERVVVKEEKTVVIVDSVEYSQGSSVVVDSPMKKVGAGGGADDEADDGDGSEEDDEESTVIWLLDDGQDDSDDSDDGDTNETPATSPDDDTAETPDTGGSDDVGHPDAGEQGEQSGQPI